MIIPQYRVETSGIALAGNGLFLNEAVARGSVIVAPDNIHMVWQESKLRQLPADSIEAESSVRWFEDWYSLTPEWSDECYVNHAFEPTALWHLGFIFAGADLPAGTEITVDYRLVIGSGEVMPFRDSITGREIVGLSWRENLRESAEQLLALLGSPIG